MKQQKTRRTRGQAALEFLSTYGFAFLIILVMIGALSYFGVLNPTNLLPDRCTVPTGLGCVDYRLTDGGDFGMVIRNNAGERMESLNITALSSNVFEYNASDCGASATTTSLGNNEEVQLTCTISDSGSLETGDKVRIDVSGEYMLRGATWPRTWEGDMFVTVS